MAVSLDKIRRLINETSIGRVYQHTQGRNIGIITAHRSEHTPEENKDRNKHLENDIKKGGFGYIHVKGRYTENKGTPQEKDVGTEHSYMVIGKKGQDNGHLKGFLAHHGAKYNQETVLHKPHDTHSAHWLHTTPSEHHAVGDTEDQGEFHPKKIGVYHSKLMGSNKTFTFTHQHESVNDLSVTYEFLVRIMPEAYGKGKEKEF
jgi:hypothetical protein